MQINVQGIPEPKTLNVKPGERSLLQVLRQAGIDLAAPCGGKGTCGKCKVHVEGLGTVLACQLELSPASLKEHGLREDRLCVTLPESQDAQIETSFLSVPQRTGPCGYAKGTAKLTAPALGQEGDFGQRLEDETGLSLPLAALRQLPEFFDPQAVSYAYRTQDQTIVRLGGDAKTPLSGIALDLGTTTLGGWLFDLESGQILGEASALNLQNRYGADVISRIEAAGKNEDDRRALQKLAAKAIAGLIETLLARAAQPPEALVKLVLVGNTTMLHLLWGLPVSSLAQTPFLPVSLKAQVGSAASLGLPLPETVQVETLPGIAAYVGADITAGILALRQATRETENALLLDIGTNGEIVLATPHGYHACSTAAGPAFEGANIHCGIGGVAGAIHDLAYADGRFSCETIGEKTPRGICGSGLLAAVALCLDLGLIDETGRILDEDELDDGSLSRHLATANGQPAIEFVPAEKSDTGQPIVLLQKDIRELQNAKAAMAAGVMVLLQKADLTPQDLDWLYLAGGFGQALLPAHAIRIGLLPPELAGKTQAAGNTAGLGAALCLLDENKLKEAQTVAAKTRYWELSAEASFTDLYVDAMLFPEHE